jgi:hypothetical protein
MLTLYSRYAPYGLFSCGYLEVLSNQSTHVGGTLRKRTALIGHIIREWGTYVIQWGTFSLWLRLTRQELQQ